MAPTPENPESWHYPQRPREIWHLGELVVGVCILLQVATSTCELATPNICQVPLDRLQAFLK